MIQWFFSLFKPKIKTVQELISRFGGDFEALSEWLTFNIWYKVDLKSSDEWKPSFQTLKDRKGDCEDFAVLVYDYLKSYGLNDVKIICLYPSKGAGHAVCCFRMDDYWRYFDNGELKGGEIDFDILIRRILDERCWPLGRWIETDIHGNWRVKRS